MDRFPSLRSTAQQHNNLQLASFGPTTVKNASKTSYEPLTDSGCRWQPGFAAAPFLGIAGLVIALMGILVAILILVFSNGKPITGWTFQPTVYLAIASTVTNIMLAFTLLEGVAITWWTKAMKKGTTIRDLYDIYAFGTSFNSALFAGKHLNLIAIASLLVAIAPVNGPLLQRASTVGPGGTHNTHPLDVQVTKLVNIPTGIISTRAHSLNALTSNFSRIASEYYDQKLIPLSSECKGVCTARVIGAGFLANCSTYQAPYNGTEAAGIHDIDLLATTFQYDVTLDPTIVTLMSTHKPSGGCTGNLMVQACLLQTGTVEYQVTIDGASQSISLANDTSVWDDVAIGSPDFLGGPELYVNSLYGGIFLTLFNRWDSSFRFSWGGGIGYEVWGGTSATAYKYVQDIEKYVDGDCGAYATDPMPDMLQDARNLIFRTAVRSASINDTQSIEVNETFSNIITYHTHYLYMALATAISLIALVAVSLTFKDFWLLGRYCTLSPIETAKAFNTPILRDSDSNAPIRTLLTTVGKRPVQYGVVMESPSAKMTSYSTSTYSAHATRFRNGAQEIELDAYGTPVDMDAHELHLELADPSRVSPIRPGDSFRPQ